MLDLIAYKLAKIQFWVERIHLNTLMYDDKTNLLGIYTMISGKITLKTAGHLVFLGCM